MNNRHRRRRWASESKKNASNTSITVAIISGVAIAFLIASIIVAIYTGGEIPNALGALGMLFFLGSIPCVIIGHKRYKMPNYNFVSRIFGLVVPIIAVASWGVLYIIGLVFA